MELSIALVISILSITFTIVNFALNRKDKTAKDSGEEAYKQGVIETKLDNLTKQVDKILAILDNYEDETRKIVEEGISKHELKYHKGE